MANSTASEVQLSWTNASLLTINNYVIEQSTDNVNFTLVNDNVSADAQWYTVANLAPSTTYYFRIAAVDAAGQSAYATVSCTTATAATGNLRDKTTRAQFADIGMNLNFYGVPFNQIWVNQNGNLTIGEYLRVG